MSVRISDKRVTFKRPFELKGLDGMQPSGTYSVETRKDGRGFLPLFSASRASTWLRVCRDPGVRGTVRHANIDPLDLAAALLKDSLPET